MNIMRNGRGRLQHVRKPKRKGEYGRLDPPETTMDPSRRKGPEEAPLNSSRDTFRHDRVQNEPSPNKARLPDRSRRPPVENTRKHRVPTTSASNRYPHRRDSEAYPPDRAPEIPPPAPDPPPLRPSARPQSPPIPEYKEPLQRFNVLRVIPRKPREFYDEAFCDTSPNTGTKYPCTQRDLDACGGNSRGISDKRSGAELRALWFPKPNRRRLVSVKQAARDIHDYNQPDRMPSREEHQAIGRLLAMLDDACHGSWGPDLAIKALCDLDTVFFRGKLRGHVCITWQGPEAFRHSRVLAQTLYLDRGKVLIKLNAQTIIFHYDGGEGMIFTEMLATVLHEMVYVSYRIIVSAESVQY